MIHIEGMGWLGAVTAIRLHHAGVPFTWHDIDTPTTAWRACMGMVYPAGDDRSRINMHRWAHLAPLFPDGTVMPTAFAYTTPGPPQDGTYLPLADLEWIRVANTAAYAVDVPTIVATVRHRFTAQRTTAAAPDQPVIIAHGHTHRRTSWSWGWSMPVHLLLPRALTTTAPDLPIALHSRPHRFMSALAFPIPNRPDWYRVGTANMPQRKPRELNLHHHIETWRRQAVHQYPGLRVLHSEPPTHGWRPRPPAGDTGTLLDTTRPDGAPCLIYPPLADTGVRWAPTLTDQALDWARAHLHTHA